MIWRVVGCYTAGGLTYRTGARVVSAVSEAHAIQHVEYAWQGGAPVLLRPGGWYEVERLR